jgi:Branched-chain amino acid transport system / permease component
LTRIARAMAMGIALQLLFTGLGIGSIYALVALGFVLIYRATNVVNFAQGDFAMLGAFSMVVLCNGSQRAGVSGAARLTAQGKYLCSLEVNELVGHLAPVGQEPVGTNGFSEFRSPNKRRHRARDFEPWSGRHWLTGRLQSFPCRGRAVSSAHYNGAGHRPN